MLLILLVNFFFCDAPIYNLKKNVSLNLILNHIKSNSIVRFLFILHRSLNKISIEEQGVVVFLNSMLWKGENQKKKSIKNTLNKFVVYPDRRKLLFYIKTSQSNENVILLMLET